MDEQERARTEPVTVSVPSAVADRDAGAPVRGASRRFPSITTFSSLGNPTFRLFYASMLGQMAAMNMQQIAQALLAYRLTGSTAILGFVALANSVPMILLSLTGGLVADRVRKKQVLLVGQLVSGLLPLIIGLTLTFGLLSQERQGSWWILIAVAVVQGTVWSLVMPSRQALVAEIVEPGHLMNAVSLNMFAMNIFRLISPAVAGFMIDLFDFSTAYYSMAGLYFLAALFMLPMPSTGSRSPRRRSALNEVKDGLLYVRRQPTVLLILVFALITVILSMPYMMLLPVFTEDILKVGASGLGILVSVSGVGAVVSSIALASMPGRRRGWMLGVSGIVLGVALVGFAFSASWPMSLTLIAFVGMAQTARMTLSNALLMNYTADEYRGRVMSIYMMEFGLSSLATFFAGITAEAVGVECAVGGLAMVLVVFCVAVLAVAPRLRKLD